MRLPSFGEFILQLLIAAMLAMFVDDYLNALSASPCSAPPSERTSNCYPWGMTEGPMEGGSWNYENKTNYLRSGLVLNLVLLLAALAPFFARGPWSGFGATLVILTLGFTQLRFLAELL